MSTNLRKRGGLALAGLALCGVFAAGCEKVSEPYRDAKRGATNSGPMDVIEMSDGFSNVGAKCDGPNRVYVVFKGDSAYGSIDVVKDDPRCTGRVG